MMSRTFALLLASVCFLGAQDINNPDPRQRARAARDLGKSGAEAIPQLTQLLKDPVNEVRIDAVRAIVNIGTQHSLDPLIAATRDNDAEVQLTATDGLVNFYLPGYIQTGASRLISSVRSRFDRENTDLIDPYITVRPEVIAALGALARGGVTMDVRANAARAIGILRGREAVPDLLAALQTKDDNVLYESMIALQKIGDQSAGPRVVFLVRDLHERVQVAAIDTVGILRAKEAVPHLHTVLNDTRSKRVRRAALASLSMLGDPSSRRYFEQAWKDRDDGVRAGAAEGFARMRVPSDRPMLEQAFNEERKMPPRLAIAFALAALGNSSMEEFAPLRYLVNTLNSKSWRGIAEPYLIELSRDSGIRTALIGALNAGTRDEKTGILRVLTVTGDAAAADAAERLMKDSDPEVAREAIRATRSIRARLG